MRLPVAPAKLVERRSDEQDSVSLANAVRTLLNSKGEWYEVVTTTDATVTAVWSESMVPNSAADLYAVVAAVNGDGTEAAAYHRRAGIRRPGVAAAVIIGQETIGTDQETTAGWNVAFALGTTAGDVELRVTGAAATTVYWRAHVVAIVSPWD